MKKYLVGCLVLVSVVSMVILYHHFSEEEAEQMRVIEPFQIPDTSFTADVEAMFPSLLASAQELGVNVFRTSQNPDESIYKFALLMEEMDFEEEWDQIVFLGYQVRVDVFPLINAFDTLPFSGRYYAELPDGVSLEQFLEQLSANLNGKVEDFLVDDVSFDLEMMGWRFW